MQLQPPPSPADPPPPNRRGRSWRGITLSGAIAAAAAGAGAAVGPDLVALVVPQDPYEQVAEEAGAEILGMPEFELRYGDLDEDEAFGVGVELGAAAIPRLSDAELAEWLTLTRRLLDSADVETCAALVRGTGHSDDAIAAFRSLDVESFRRYIELIVSGVRLELTEAPGAAPPSSKEVDAALLLLAQEMGETRWHEVGAAFASPVTATDAELCSAARDLYDAFADLDNASRGVLIRMVTDPRA